jgi:hypothetical protein
MEREKTELRALGMGKAMWRWLSVSMAVTGLAFVMAGCGGRGGSAPTAPTDQHIMKFFGLKGEYARANKGKAATNTEELKAWAKKLSPQELSKMGIDDLDNALKSPRDGEEYQIAPPRKGRQFGPPPVAVYEKTGKNGTRIIVGGMGEVQEVSEESFNQMMGK